jgi:hypothetical protein
MEQEEEKDTSGYREQEIYRAKNKKDRHGEKEIERNGDR